MPSNGAHRKSDESAGATIPAPASRDLSTEQPRDSALVSDEDLLVSDKPAIATRFEGEERPTTVPDYDVEALAAASFQPAKRAQLPLDLTVPVRKERASVCGAPLRAAFLLSHVDDRMSISEIAASAQIPIADAIENFVLLADLGVVELRGGSQVPPQPTTTTSESETDASGKSRPPTPKSGLRTKT